MGGKSGRPKVEITDEQLRQAEILAGLGLTQNQIADVIGVARSTFRRKKDENRVMSALQRGRARAEMQISDALFKKARSGDVPAIRWYEMTRAGRHEKIDVLVRQRLEAEVDSMMEALENGLNPEAFKQAMSVLAAPNE